MTTDARPPLTGNEILAATVLGLDAAGALLLTGPLAVSGLIVLSDENANWFTVGPALGFWIGASLLALLAPVVATLVIAVRSPAARIAGCVLTALVMIAGAATAALLLDGLSGAGRVVLVLAGLLNLAAVWALVGTLRPQLDQAPAAG